MITDYPCFWTDKTPRCEDIMCRFDSTHVLRVDNDEICLCDFHIGKFATYCMSLRYTGSTVSVHKIGQSWQVEQERLRYEGE